MHEMEELKEMLCDELEKITKHGKITAGILDTVDKLTHSIKSIETIMAMDEGGNSSRSYRSYGESSRDSYRSSERGGSNESYRGDQSSYRGEGSYRGESSYRRRRDGMRDQRYNYSRELKEDLEDLMQNAGNEEEKRMIKKWINQLDD